MIMPALIARNLKIKVTTKKRAELKTLSILQWTDDPTSHFGVDNDRSGQ